MGTVRFARHHTRPQKTPSNFGRGNAIWGYIGVCVVCRGDQWGADCHVAQAFSHAHIDVCQQRLIYLGLSHMADVHSGESTWLCDWE